MGNSNSGRSPQKTSRAAKNSRNESDSDDTDEEQQAQAFIDLEIFLELPGGTQSSKKISADPDIKVSNFKSDLSPLMNIPAKHVKIYRHQLPKSEMPDHSTLRKLNVTSGTQLRVRDGSKKYSNPL